MMASFGGAVICEFAGLHIQSNLENILPKTNFGLYRDDGLIIQRNLNSQKMDKKRKFSQTLVLVLTFKQILKKQIFLILY